MARQLREFPVWVPEAHRILLETATRYRAVVTYAELAEQVQSRTSKTTRQPMRHWIGSLLEEVALLAHDRGDPPLTALCVHHDGSIGEGYRRAVHLTAGLEIADVEIQAAEDRLTCYRALAIDVPADGGRPALTTKVADRRRRAADKARTARVAARPDKLCSTCHTALPATGRCDYCG